MKKNERIGLIIILASILVIALIIGLLFSYQQKSQESQIRNHGLSLVRLLAGMSLQQLIPENGPQGILQVIKYGDFHSQFAYLSVQDKNGEKIHEITSSGVITPKAVIPAEPSGWIKESQHTIKNMEQDVLEFHAPILNQGVLVAFVRLAFFKPGYGLNINQIPLIATIALPIFLLVPLFYFFLRKEVRPLYEAHKKIESLMKNGQLQELSVQTRNGMGEFMQNLNGFIDHSKNRIRELEQNEEGLLTSKKLLTYQRSRAESVLQAMPDGVLIMDETGIISFANVKIENLLGVDVDDIIGNKPRDWCTNSDVLAFLSRIIGKQTHSYSLEAIEFSPENATEKSIQVTAYPFFSSKKPVAAHGILIIFRNITLEKLAKRNRAEFVSHIAHELKTPLNVLAMYAEALQGEDGKEENFRVEAVNVIADEVERLSGLISNLLNLTKIEMGSLNIDRHRTKLQDLLKDALDNIKRSGKPMQLKFSLDIPNDISPLLVDKDLLRVAINNLLTNAVKYNKPGGKVKLAASETEAVIRIVVSDTGIGIENNDLDNIFEKFYRSENNQVREKSGHGLGLSLARDIVQLHNGTINVKSTFGEGTEFVIEIMKSTGLVKQGI